MSLAPVQPPEWLESYATHRHDWQQTTQNNRVVYYRRIGIVESLFNTDGTDFEGRADLTMHLHVEMRTSLSPETLRARILRAWSVMRQKHILLSARVATAVDIPQPQSSFTPEERLYVFEPSTDPGAMLLEAEKHAVFVGDFYPQGVDANEFFIHTLNSSRCIDEAQALGRLFVMPIQGDADGLLQAHLMFIAGHEIVDGLSSMRWMSSFVDLLNQSAQQLSSEADRLCTISPVDRLPPAQESLYPPVKGSAARRRWAWLLTRILRHTRRPPPASFQNPLRRRTALLPQQEAISLEPKFFGVLDYTRTPPLNTLPLRALLGPSSTRRLARVCRQAGISMGSGCFALVALVMMLFEERRHPHVPTHERLPFVGSFPVNPRPFLGGKPTTGKEDSLMLAFSDGITLPFLPSDLDLEGRLRLLGKQAHRQLRRYQKRPRTVDEEIHLGSRSPSQLLPLLYLSTLEYLERKSQGARRRGWNIQGAYPASTGPGLATCGVSSVGARGSIIASGKYETSTRGESLSPGSGGRDVVADFRNLYTTVRARDGEFLVGVHGDGDHLLFGVSYDAGAIDPGLASEWKLVMERILEDQDAAAAARRTTATTSIPCFPSHKL
ncbi:uncharacterized protein Z520_04483 [Fonsecaea multimorphosa CBS 102226]|uniref:Condensation domain-containing protein n=1 Tax=Fonsecaea multimorphosa CBS 102226 TaxID=1442371 RepID=A0A0D2K1V9_9EURO|nr:uncharacterized protein Z520_04483 [Fonsecaea multimorphosa CBS 102226]KIX99847.1 hypothetical protein Z520_04483 [Fonsecaea multimorphosa CBS 102226]OAL26326.1 hypothetical protein AYO22_04244 [Fonsecaea multimorphosa]